MLHFNSKRNSDEQAAECERTRQRDRTEPSSNHNNISCDCFIPILRAHTQEHAQLLQFIRNFVNSSENNNNNNNARFKNKKTKDASENNDLILNDFAQRIWLLFACRTNQATAMDFKNFLSRNGNLSENIAVLLFQLFNDLKNTIARMSRTNNASLTARQGAFLSHDKVVLESEIEFTETKNYIRRFEQLATFAEIVDDKISETIGENQRTILHVHEVLQNALNPRELASLKTCFVRPTNWPSTPRPFAWSPLLFILSQQYPTITSVPSFVVRFINANQSQPFDAFTSFSRRVADFLQQRSPAEHSNTNFMQQAVQETFDNWFDSAEMKDSKSFLVFMANNIKTMLHRIGCGFVPPVPRKSFFALATSSELTRCNKDVADILHEGSALRDLIVLCDADARGKFTDRWQRTSGTATIGIVSAKNSLNGNELINAFSSSVGKLVILSGPSGCAESQYPKAIFAAFPCGDSPVTEALITQLLDLVFGDWSKTQKSVRRFTVVIDEVGGFPIFVRACAAVAQMFCAAVRKFFNIGGSVRLVVVGTGAENFELNDRIGSTPQSYVVIPIKPKHLLFHLLRRRTPHAPFFVKLFHLLFPTCKNDTSCAHPVASDLVTYRFLQLASNARCAVLLIKFFQAFVDQNNAENENNNNDSDEDNNRYHDTIQDSQLSWRIRAALPLILQQVATAFASLNGLGRVEGQIGKDREIAISLGYSLNRITNLTTREWDRSATTYGLTTDTARWSKSWTNQVQVCDENTGVPLENSDGERYCHPENTPRFLIAEASVALLMQHLGIADSEKGFATNNGWELLEQVTFDFHCIRSIIPSTPEIDRQFDALFSAQQFFLNRNFPLTWKEQQVLVADGTTTRSAILSRPIWADPHVLFSINSHRQVQGIYQVRLKTPFDEDHVDAFKKMTNDQALLEKNRVTWRAAINNRFAINIMNAPRAADADVICLAPGRVFLTQCKQLTTAGMSLSKILAEFRKMRDSEQVLSLLRQCCRVGRQKEEDVEVVCTLVLSREDSVNLLCLDQLGLVYETDNLFDTKIREFFVAENRGNGSEFVSSFYPFWQSRAAVLGIEPASDPSLMESQQFKLWERRFVKR